MAVKAKFDQSAGGENLPAKKDRRIWWVGGSIFGFFLIIYLLYNPQAPIQYGICKTYLELNEAYPQKMKYLSMDDFGKTIRITYTRVDPFGSVSVNIAECSFKVENGALTPYLETVDINGKHKTYQAEQAPRIAVFNKTVPSLLETPMDLTIPYFPLDDMSAYRTLYEDKK